MMMFRPLLAILLLILSGCATPPPTQRSSAGPAALPDMRKTALSPGEPFRFTVCADSRPNWLRRGAFQWTLQEMNRLVGGEGAFLVMVGDFDPPQVTDEDLRAAIGRETVWYPVVGNHEAENSKYMAWVRDRYEHLSFILRQGPTGSETTTYSFDYGSAHFVVLNQYYDGEEDDAGKGDVCDALYEWLKTDLDDTEQPVIFVVGHEPAYPKHRHVGDSLDADPEHRNRFWKLLNERGVQAYFTGHTHTYDRMQQGSTDWPTTTWQVNAGGCGQGGSQTFVDVTVAASAVKFDVYSGTRGRAFTKIDSWTHSVEQRSGNGASQAALETVMSEVVASGY